MITFKVEDRAVLKALDELEPRQRAAAERKGTAKAAAYLKPILKEAIPPNFKRARRAVYRGSAKRQKPGAFVAIRGGKKGQADAPNRAFYRHWMLFGTKDRFTKGTGAFRGHMTGHDAISEVYASQGDEASQIALNEIAKAVGL